MHCDKAAAFAWLQEQGYQPRRCIVAEYNYCDEGGALLFQVVRYAPKAFRQRRADGTWKLAGVQRVIYRLPQVIAGVAAGEVIFVAEGEKGVHALVDLGLVATCSPGGACKWQRDYSPALQGADVVVLVDNDAAGEQHGIQVVQRLDGIATRVRVLRLPELGPGEDIVDWVAAGGTQEALLVLVEALAPESDPVVADDASGGARGDHWDQTRSGTKLPTLANVEKAFAQLDISLRYNLFADRVMFKAGDQPEIMVEKGPGMKLWLNLQRQFDFQINLDLLHRFLEALAREREYHPVKDRLAGLTWDGVKRIDDWLFTYGQVPRRPKVAGHDDYVRAVGRLFFKAAVRRIMQPGCKFDEMIVLVNPTQGQDRSSALKILALRLEWFSDSLVLGADGKVTIEQTRGKWIIEIAELWGNSPKDVARIKRFLSQQVDEAREAYGNTRTDKPRQFIAVGTTNDRKFLFDRTGNRRTLPVFGAHFDGKLDDLQRDVEQLWAEGVAAQATEESIRLPKEVWATAAVMQAAALEEEPWEAALEEVLQTTPVGKIQVSDVWIILGVAVERREAKNNTRMGDAMKALGWECKQGRIKEPGETVSRRVRFYVKGDPADWDGLIKVESVDSTGKKVKAYYAKPQPCSACPWTMTSSPSTAATPAASPRQRSHSPRLAWSSDAVAVSPASWQ